MNEVLKNEYAQHAFEDLEDAVSYGTFMLVPGEEAELAERVFAKFHVMKRVVELMKKDSLWSKLL